MNEKMFSCCNYLLAAAAVAAAAAACFLPPPCRGFCGGFSGGFCVKVTTGLPTSSAWLEPAAAPVLPALRSLDRSGRPNTCFTFGLLSTIDCSSEKALLAAGRQGRGGQAAGGVAAVG